MEDKGLIDFILQQKKYKWMIFSIWGALITGMLVKYLFWPALRIDFLIFFGLTVPVGILIINILPYSFFSHWVKLCDKFRDGYELKKHLKIQIRNFNPWKDLSKKQNRFQFNRPFYDFESADVLASDDLVIVYGKNNSLFSYYGNTRPFGICIGGGKPSEPELYLVNFVSISRTNEYDEIVFTDSNYIDSGQIKMTIYVRGGHRSLQAMAGKQ